MDEKTIRERAKALGIRNWHNRKIESLAKMVQAQDQESIEESQVIISFDSFFASASKEVKAEAVSYLNAIEVLSAEIEFCLWLEDCIRLSRFVPGTDLDVIWRFWVRQSPYYDYKDFVETLNSFVFLSKNSGWEVKDDSLYWNDMPALAPSWHAKRWIELSSAIDRERARAIFSVLFGG